MVTKRTFIKSISVLFLFFSFNLAHAVVPATMNYQAHLTDNSGVPIDGSVDIVFSIYDVVVGGTALWSEAHVVTVKQGVFSVELGSQGSPITSALFETLLYMSLAVGTDAEMLPRRAINSVGFSFKAYDADTVGGISPSTLDQSSHVGDTSNPHAVSAAQVGAMTQTDADAAFALQQVEITSLNTRVTTLEGLTGAGNCTDGDMIDCYTGSAGTLFVGACSPGYKVCTSGAFGACTSQTLPVTEICDSQDNNCDGFVDETFDLNTDVLNCGTCGNDCNTLGWPNVASYLCQTGNCAIETCAANRQDLNGLPTDGCEYVCTPTGGADLPDAAFIDANCDGIDGDITTSFFVNASSGSDSWPGTMAQPFRTVQKGIDMAAADAIRKHVLVAQGSYDESPVLADGVSLFGLYSNTSSWMRSAANTTIISPGTTTVGLHVSNYSSVGYIEGFEIRAASPIFAGESSRALVLENITASLYVRQNTLKPGTGRNGINGTNGTSGADGGNGSSGVVGCDGCGSGGNGGIGGVSSCSVTGGTGGWGGIDSNGGPGISIGPASGGFGGAKSTDCGNIAETGGTGNSGPDGAVGTGGSLPIDQFRGLLSGINWTALAGNSGTAGEDGGSGAGGGGGGGGIYRLFVCQEDRGGGGGGGGGAGCHGRGATGGTGGGGSIAILAINAGSAIVSNNVIHTDAGGHGGNGGDGGTGGSGGIGGNGGNGLDDAGNGGRGGDGGDGGSGGGGAGGAGGMSVGILRSNSAGLTNSGNSFTLGAGGNGGTGGSPNGLNGMSGFSQMDYTY